MNNLEELITETKAKAMAALAPYLAFEPLEKIGPFNMLLSYPWREHIQVDRQFSQAELVRLNAGFDPMGCFGRTVLALLLMEKYFPEVKVEIAEVLSDYCKLLITGKLKKETGPSTRREMAAELLMYEEPHVILMINSFQFDPLIALFRFSIIHPKVEAFPAWPAIAASLLVDEAVSALDEDDENMNLKFAETICPGMNLVLQNAASSAVKYGDHGKFIGLLPLLLEKRSNARLLYVAWKELENSECERRLKEEYPPEVIELLDEEVERNMAAAGWHGEAI